MWIKSIIICAIVTLASAGIAMRPLYPKPDEFKNQEGCYIPELNAVVPLDNFLPAKDRCMGYHCETSSVLYKTCAEVLTVADDGFSYKLAEEDPSKSYPGCCP
ncbi:uncharacterized protein LOC113233281 [Hyposmocoma kahamanoa]|uniref:uncharacterized protein LOC113233281 n=1 Tax=Hyposmocoma kahamanoa TaxID=1477025 RepID=UPI000E6D6CFB|nr:uncharacterized protein LOC113233281 [Hyposmocoma kahamanoa]